MWLLSAKTELPVPAALTAALAATVKVAGLRDSDGQATALLPSALRKKLTWFLSSSAISVAYASAAELKLWDGLAPDEVAVKLLDVPAAKYFVSRQLSVYRAAQPWQQNSKYLLTQDPLSIYPDQTQFGCKTHPPDTATIRR